MSPSLDNKNKWHIFDSDSDTQSFFESELNILPVTARLLLNRGFSDTESVAAFLNPSIADLNDPFLMMDMERAVTRILSAIESNEKIVVFGDYDVDGTTATSLLKLFFEEIGVEVATYIPERLKEGYGLNSDAMKGLAQSGITLLITTDCGISSCEEISVAKEVGLDVIVTDHHEISGPLPDAYAILNPRREGCQFPDKNLAGVGVAFKLAMALRTRLRESGYFKDRPEPNLKNYLDIVSIGTVADMVPLIGENRLLVKYGLEVLKNSQREGLKALKSASGVRDERLNTESISFQLAPRINAAGRVERADKALELLTTNDRVKAQKLAGELDAINVERQQIERAIFDEADGMIKADGCDPGIVLYSEDWHPGVIGIVASKLANRYNRPCIMISIDGDSCRGSARGIRNFDMLSGLTACAEHIERYGGHRAAAGLSLHRDKLVSFKAAFFDLLKRTLSEDDLVPQIDIDAMVNLDEIDHAFVAEMERLAPFGIGNREPLLCAEDTNIVNTQLVGKTHLRLKVKHKGAPLSAIAFGLGDLHPLKGPGYDIAFRPYFDQWHGRKSISLKIKDLKEKLG